ncbi:hypothetical protein L226DRAFT_574395 [Lentinus tigrinus ALCF2SS1-7]|uniref:Uncharacterized protein n=1 Tax=Lentinus tigrinus ALCF2SS1-6 TaxID=1328759 RepID=A0A5C2SGE8_9APHY|nr:hypothetical protein L227DRAFT_600958 [Lentinus tigrinus ALCF2SS1-6]RPD70954.1 hypothetical protein L226DRAFT_574395 [Lentinus tigrinus ALCF2SS1-7]
MPPSYSPCPRPCLKRSSNPPAIPPQDEPSTLLAIDPSILSPLVRFPPQTALTHTLGNALPYDRSPIVVLPNRCALPERGCPGRTYAPEDPTASSHTRRTKRTSLSPVGGKHLHPRAVDGHDPRHDDDPTPRQSPRVDYHPLPPLIPDLSSESSEESDGVASPPPELYHLAHLSSSIASSSAHGKMSLEQSLMNLSLAGTNAPSTSALSFLPHPPSPRVRPHLSPNATPTHSPSNSTCYMPSAFSNSGLSNSSGHQYYRPSTSPVRSRSPGSPTHRRKPRPAPIPVPIPNSSAGAAYSYPSASPTPVPVSPGVPASPERERRSRHRDDARTREHRERSRERKDRERAERLARYKSLSGFGVEESGCLGGF